MIMYPPYLWLPSIVGSNESKTFLVSAISTLVTKMVILGIALLYAFMGVQQWINPRPFLLWCEVQWDEEERTKDTVGLTRFYWILSSNPAILVEISTRITEFEERIQ